MGDHSDVVTHSLWRFASHESDVIESRAQLCTLRYEQGGVDDNRALANRHWSGSRHRRDRRHQVRCIRHQAPSRRSTAAHGFGLSVDSVWSRHQNRSNQMNSGQDQSVGQGATAIQSQRDTIVHTGLSPDDLRIIVESLADQLPKLAATAAAVMEVRLRAFEEDILKRFQHDTSVNKEAFADPDFQHVVIDAQRAYSRTGDMDTHSTLVDLIAKRSSENTGSRRAFAINESIAVVSRLTRNEISEVAFAFLMRSTQSHTISNLQTLANYVKPFIEELIDDVEVDQPTYDYLVAQRCATISMGSITLIQIWKEVYPGLFMKGLESADITELESGGITDVRAVLVPSIFDPAKVQPNAIRLDVFLAIPRPVTLTEENMRSIWVRAESGMATDDEIVEKLKPLLPRITEAIEKWDGSAMKSLDLTSIGKAIGHARLSQIPAFGKPDLSIWVK